MKLTYRNDNGYTTVSAPGFGVLFYVHSRNGVYNFIFDCRTIGEMTGTRAEFLEFCRLVAPAAHSILSSRRTERETDETGRLAKLNEAVKVLAELGIAAEVASTRGLYISINEVEKFSKLQQMLPLHARFSVAR